MTCFKEYPRFLFLLFLVHDTSEYQTFVVLFSKEDHDWKGRQNNFWGLFLRIPQMYYLAILNTVNF
jgi:hypothetical protein